MDSLELTSIRNYRRLSERLVTGGMPGEAGLAALARAGVEVVINLDETGSSHALPDERSTVEALGMTYVAIPVLWTRPEQGDLQRFMEIMDHCAGQYLFVHCVANMRASAFMFLYRVLRLGWSVEEALPDLRAIWAPDGVWEAFIRDALPAGGMAY